MSLLVENFDIVVACVSSLFVGTFDLAVAGDFASFVETFGVVLTGDKEFVFVDNVVDMFFFAVPEVSIVGFVVSFGVTAESDVTLCS